MDCSHAGSLVQISQTGQPSPDREVRLALDCSHAGSLVQISQTGQPSPDKEVRLALDCSHAGSLVQRYPRQVSLAWGLGRSYMYNSRILIQVLSAWPGIGLFRTVSLLVFREIDFL
jgi:hypothetical protein